MDVTYWLLRRLIFTALGPEYEYYTMGMNTDNPKKAMRWFTKDAAQDYARMLSTNWKNGRWKAISVTFPGHEPAI